MTNSIGQIIKKRRQELGMTQAECAYRFSAGESYWRAIEHNRASVGEERRREIEKFLDMDEGTLSE